VTHTLSVLLAAQVPVPSVESTFLKEGLLGAIIVALGLVVIALYRQTLTLQKEKGILQELHHKEQLETGREMSRILAEHNLTTSRQIVLLERALERLAEQRRRGETTTFGA
jgi:hypothetical protein